MIRGPLSTATKHVPMTDTETLELATQWFDRVGTVEQIRSAMKKRFGYGITKTEDGYETYTRGAISTEIDEGFYEAIDVGISHRIVSALAQLFTRAGASFSVVTESGDTDDEATALLGELRAKGGFNTAAAAADSISCSVESAAIRVTWDDKIRSLSYEPVAPQNLKILWPESIRDLDGQERYPDYSSLDDAAAVVVRLSGQSDSQGAHRWIAYIGSSEDYPLGRCVSYSARMEGWHQIPEVGADGARDVMVGEDVVNPLTFVNWQLGLDGGEYPLIIIRGGHVKAQVDPIPTITALYDSCVELTLAWSRILKDSLSGMLGREVLKNPDGAPLPEVTEGLVALKRGQEFEVKTMNSGSVTAAVDSVYAASGALAAGWNVPPYTVVSRVGASPESGIALVVQTAPLIQFLEYRDSVNRDSVTKLYDIERGLLEYHDGFSMFPEGSTVVWNTGEVRIPQDQAMVAASVVQQLDAGLIDAVEAVRRLHNLETAEEAEAMLNTMRERSSRTGRIQAQPAARQLPGLPPRR